MPERLAEVARRQVTGGPRGEPHRAQALRRPDRDNAESAAQLWELAGKCRPHEVGRVEPEGAAAEVEGGDDRAPALRRLPDARQRLAVRLYLDEEWADLGPPRAVVEAAPEAVGAEEPQDLGDGHALGLEVVTGEVRREAEEREAAGVGTSDIEHAHRERPADEQRFGEPTVAGRGAGAEHPAGQARRRLGRGTHPGAPEGRGGDGPRAPACLGREPGCDLAEVVEHALVGIGKRNGLGYELVEQAGEVGPGDAIEPAQGSWRAGIGTEGRAEHLQVDGRATEGLGPAPAVGLPGRLEAGVGARLLAPAARERHPRVEVGVRPSAGRSPARGAGPGDADRDAGTGRACVHRERPEGGR